MQTPELIPHLFRQEFSKIVSVLCKSYGFSHIETAEDIASETFTTALEVWPRQGIPEKPTAWLYTVAKNKAKNQLSRLQNFDKNISPNIFTPSSEVLEIDLSPANIEDSQLQMLFAICQPTLSAESQIGLALRILCGFGIEEIANAFLSQKETINKRLFRAKEKLRKEKVTITFPTEPEIDNRLDNVLTTLYLLFNEGYYSESQNAIIRKELCLEAMRLMYLLKQNSKTNLPKVNALLALMCFQTSRIEARTGENGDMILYEDQDESLWDKTLITKGAELLKEASRGDFISKYHIEANIAFWHTQKKDSLEKWQNILHLYNLLLVQEYSPIAALNRTYVIHKVYGAERAIAEAEKLKLDNNHFYFVLLAELYQEVDNDKALKHLNTALSISQNPTERDLIQSKIEKLKAV